MSEGKLIHFVAQSLDGYIEGPAGEFDWTVMDPELSAYSFEVIEEADAFLHGRVVWDMMSSFWPRAEELSDHAHDLAFAPRWREFPKYVASRTLTEAGWNTTILGGDVAQQVREIKEAGTNLVLFGGHELAGYLTEHGLIDEYRISVHPAVLGGGKPVFRDPERFGVRLIEARTFDSQVVLLRYAPA